jgi:hypothetical protein
MPPKPGQPPNSSTSGIRHFFRALQESVSATLCHLLLCGRLIQSVFSSYVPFLCCSAIVGYYATTFAIVTAYAARLRNFHAR